MSSLLLSLALMGSVLTVAVQLLHNLFPKSETGLMGDRPLPPQSAPQDPLL